MTQQEQIRRTLHEAEVTPDSPRAWTEDEMRARFLDTVRAQVKYWQEQSTYTDPNDRISGMAHSLLSLLDGSVGMIPGFKLIPNAHCEDQQWHESQGENWWPEDVDINNGNLAFEMYNPPQ